MSASAFSASSLIHQESNKPAVMIRIKGLINFIEFYYLLLIYIRITSAKVRKKNSKEKISVVRLVRQRR